tara:strand:- start:38 stop:988 length:951 start_codon:yes stop_codon:yes gene_type:complete
MSVRPTPDRAPRPAHRSRLAHVLRIGADRAASTEVPFLWDGNPTTDKKDVCDDPDLREVLYNENRQRLCDPVMDDVALLNPVERARLMIHDIENDHAATLMSKLNATVELCKRLTDCEVHPRISDEIFDLRWSRAFKITDKDASGNNLLYRALNYGRDSENEFTLGVHRVGIFNQLFDYYKKYGDLEMWQARHRGLPAAQPSAGYDTRITRFNAPNSLMKIALERTILKATGVAKAFQGGYPQSIQDAYLEHAEMWLTTVTKLRSQGFKTEPVSPEYETLYQALPQQLQRQVQEALAKTPPFGVPKENPPPLYWFS